VHLASSSNATLYHSIEPLVHAAHGGQNVTVMAYGQTGGGKTHSMFGTDADPGFVPRAAMQLLQLASNAGVGTVVTCACIEIYNECVRDLLAPAKNSELVVREAPDGSPVVDRAQVPLQSMADFRAAYVRAEQARCYGVTDMNAHSSRSHVIMTFEIATADAATGAFKRALLHFVDLAGSECAARANTEGAAMREGGYINRSLLTLGNVVDAIVEGRSHVPYRESKLTRLLRHCLGGRSLTYLVCCVNPSKDNFEQTVTSLRFAARAMRVRGDPGIVLHMGPVNATALAAAAMQRRWRLMRDTECGAEMRGMLDAATRCDGVVRAALERIDAQAVAAMDDAAALVSLAVVHDRRIGLDCVRATQEGSSAVREGGLTLSEAEAQLRAEQQRAHDLEARRAALDDTARRTEVARQAAAAVLHGAADTARQGAALRPSLDAAQQRVLLLRHAEGAAELEGAYWQELRAIVDAHNAAARAMARGALASTSCPAGASSPGGLFAATSAAAGADDDASVATAAAVLRELQRYQVAIAREQAELEDLKAALRTVNECFAAEADAAGPVGEAEAALVAAHAARVEDSQRAARSGLPPAAAAGHSAAASMGRQSPPPTGGHPSVTTPRSTVDALRAVRDRYLGPGQAVSPAARGGRAGTKRQPLIPAGVAADARRRQRGDG
jgi:hypothetical protein